MPKQKSLRIELPYPPSVNRLWRFARGHWHISKEGQHYRRNVEAILLASGVRPLEGWLSVFIEMYPPDRRERDTDNVLKAIFDSCQHAGLYKKDYQIARHLVERMEPEPPHGKVVVQIKPHMTDEEAYNLHLDAELARGEEYPDWCELDVRHAFICGMNHGR